MFPKKPMQPTGKGLPKGQKKAAFAKNSTKKGRLPSATLGNKKGKY